MNYVKAKREIWIDILKIVAIVFVIIIHTSSQFVKNIETLQSYSWMTGNIFDAISREAVPLFFMASGFLLLNKRYNIKEFFSKRFAKIIIPLLSWSLIYILLQKYIAHKDIDIWKSIISSLIVPSYYHLWFMYALIIVYFFIPILKAIIIKTNLLFQIFILGLWILVFFILPLINFFFDMNYSIAYFNYLGYVGYALLGYILGQYTYSKKSMFLSIILWFIMTISIIIMTYVYSLPSSKLELFFYDNFSIFVLIQAISFFVFIKVICENMDLKKSHSTIELVSSTVFGIYLIHPIFLRLLKKIDIIGQNNTILFIIVISILVFVLSFFSIKLIQKIPYIKLMAP